MGQISRTKGFTDGDVTVRGTNASVRNFSLDVCRMHRGGLRVETRQYKSQRPGYIAGQKTL